jgi:hypothetical protein
VRANQLTSKSVNEWANIGPDGCHHGIVANLGVTVDRMAKGGGEVSLSRTSASADGGSRSGGGRGLERRI